MKKSIISATFSLALTLTTPSILYAGQGYEDIEYNMAVIYYKGQGTTEQSYEKAADFFRQAANKGNAAAQAHLAYMYYKGQGVDQSDKEAAKWYQKAAAQGHKQSKKALRILNKKNK